MLRKQNFDHDQGGAWPKYTKKNEKQQENVTKRKEKYRIKKETQKK